MATPPTFVADYEGASWITTTTKTTGSFDGTTGDVLVALVGDPHDQGDENTTLSNTQGAETWTEGSESTGALTADCWAQAVTTVLTANRTGMTVSAAMAVASYFGLVVARFADSAGVGNVAASGSLSGGPSYSFTTTADNSAIVYLVCDWNAMDGASRTHRTVNGYTPSAGNGQELVYAYSAANYGVYAAYIVDAGAAGAKTIGVSAPVSQKAVIAAVEVLAGDAPAREVIPVSLGAAGAWHAPASSATVTPVYPADDDGDYLTATLVIKPDTATVNTPTGWTTGWGRAVGGGTQGAGTGACSVVERHRVSDGTLSGGSQAFTITSGSSPVGVIHAWKADATGYTDVLWDSSSRTYYSRTTGSTTFGGTGLVDIVLAPGDVIAVVSVSADDQSTTHTISGITVPSCTLSAVTQSPAGTVINAQGNDISAAFAYAQVTAGTSSGAPSATITGNTSETGGVMFYRIRATGVPSATDHVLTPTDSAGSTDFAAHTHVDETVDNAGSTDTTVVTSGWGVTAVDTAGATDSAVITRTLGVSATDLVGSTDYAAHSHSDAATDTAGATDASVVSVGRVVTATDTAGSVDTATVGLAQNVDLAVTDTAGATDADLVAVDEANVDIDTAGSTDTALVVAARAVTATDNAGSTDTTVVTGDRNINDTDNAGSVDGWDADLGIALPYDSAGSSDSVAVALSSGQTIAALDTAGSTDAATFTHGHVAGYTDTAGSTDTTALTRSTTLTPTDDAGSHDDPAVQLLGAGFVIWTDTAGSTDTDTHTAAYSRPATDTAGSTDSAQVTSAAGLTASSTDTAGATDSAAVAVAWAAAVTDGSGSTDYAAKTRGVTATDGAGSTDSASVSLAAASGVTATDASGSTDSVARSSVYNRPATDSAGSTDTAVISAGGLLAFTDGAGATDTASVIAARAGVAADTAGSSDDAVLVVTREIIVVDGGGSTDTATRLAVYTLTLLDDAGVTDLATVTYIGANFGVPVDDPTFIITTQPRTLTITTQPRTMEITTTARTMEIT